MSGTQPERSYNLSPMQEGMLFHHLQGNSGVDVEQLVCGLQEPIDADALAFAWQKTVARHTVMRTGFEWENSPQPIQPFTNRSIFPFKPPIGARWSRKINRRSW